MPEQDHTCVRLPDFTADTDHLDQHFLDSETATHMVAVAQPTASDVVLDIGAGTGAVTAAITAVRPRRVIAIEVDSRCARYLAALQRSPAGLTVIMRPLREVDERSLRPTTMIIANPPFSALERTRRLLRALPNLRTVTMCVSNRWAQAAAARVCAPTFGRTSVAIQSRFHARIIEVINSDHFAPRPRRPAALLQLTRRAAPDERLDVLAEALLASGGLYVKNLLRSQRLRRALPAEHLYTLIHLPGVRQLQHKRLTELSDAHIATLAAAMQGRPVSRASETMHSGRGGLVPRHRCRRRAPQ